MTTRTDHTTSSSALVLGGALAAFVLGMTTLASQPAAAITAELAKKCEAIVSAAFPPRQIGNPAAGSAKGNSKMQREYYNKCVANDGKMDEGEKK